MNTNAKAYNSGIATALPQPIFKPVSLDIDIPQPRIMLLLALIMLSLLGIIYTKDLNRRTFINYQNLQTASATLQNDNGKLVLEKSALAAPSRIQNIAEKNLNMVVPDATQIVLVKKDTSTATNLPTKAVLAYKNK